METAELRRRKVSAHQPFLKPSGVQPNKAGDMPSIPTTDTTLTRFWSKVVKGKNCWEWIACKNNQGYGLFRFNNRSRLAHRVSWTLNGGLIPGGLYVCHKCDNPICVRPSHLFLGNQSDNMGDAKRKGRMASGEKSSMRLHPDRIARGTRRWNAKLTDKKVLEIRGAAAVGWSFKGLAAKFHVHQSQISRIVAGKRWKHVGGVRSQKES